MRSHLTYANVMATVAVFIALGGSSYAAVQLSKNSVLSKHIKNGQVKKADIASNAVDSSRVKDGSLLARDFKRADLPRGATGAPGPTGPRGPAGSAEPVRGTDVEDNSLTGSDIDESTLLGVDAATLGGLPSSAFAAASHQHDAAYVNAGEADSVTPAMVADANRTVQLPLSGFILCETAGGEPIDFTESATDRDPDMGTAPPSSGSGPAIVFDEDDGQEDQGSRICTSLRVPADYAGGGVLRLTAQKDGFSGSDERFTCASNVNGSGVAGTATVAVPFQALGSYSCPVGFNSALAPGDHLVLHLEVTSSNTINDQVFLQAVAFEYRSTQ